MLYAGYLLRDVKLPTSHGLCYKSQSIGRQKGYTSCHESATSQHTGQYNFQYFYQTDIGCLSAFCYIAIHLNSIDLSYALQRSIL